MVYKYNKNMANQSSVSRLNNRRKVNNCLLDSFKFNWQPACEVAPKFKIPTEMPIRFLVSPEQLYQLASNVVGNLPMPAAFYWTHQGVLKWIEKLGYPQFRNTFYENLINGHSLIFVDAAALSAMNIRNFDDIVKITESIRKLYGVDFLRFVRSVSCPPRYPLAHYGLYRGNTGAKYHDTTNLQLLESMKIIHSRTVYPQQQHWEILEEWLKHRPPSSSSSANECVRFGCTTKKNDNKTAPKTLKKRPLPIKSTSHHHQNSTAKINSPAKRKSVIIISKTSPEAFISSADRLQIVSTEFQRRLNTGNAKLFGPKAMRSS